MITPYKNRKIDYSLPVDVYRCLNRSGKVFSIRQRGKVVGHTSNLFLKDVHCHIHKSGQKRCRLTNSRNVHAFLRGKIVNQIDFSIKQKITYNPYKDVGFMSNNVVIENVIDVLIDSDCFMLTKRLRI